MFIARLANDWLQDSPKDRPFYLQVNFGGPHDPWDAPSSYRRMYNPDDIPLSMTAPRTGPKSSHVELLLKHAPNKLTNMSAAQNRVMKSNYYSKVTLIDDCVGRIIDTLKNLNLINNTWIVFSSDHGEMLGDHGLLAKKVFYDGAVNVPCLFRSPQGEGQGTIPTLTCHLDIVATLIDISGAEPLKTTDGRSMLPTLLGEPIENPRTAVLSELGLPPSAFIMVRTEGQKLSVDAVSRQPIEHYDLNNDPCELHNLVEDPDYEYTRSVIVNEVMEPMLGTLDTSDW